MDKYRFGNAWEAYSWSYEVCDVWRNGKAFDPDPDLFRGGTGVMGIVLIALDIQITAKKHDIINGDGSWFELAFLSQNEPGEWVGIRKRLLQEAIVSFCEALQEKNYLHENCDHKKSCSALRAMDPFDIHLQPT